MMYKVSIVRAYFAELGLPEFVTEHPFATAIEYERKDGRKGERGWKFDFAWIEERVALEVEGGIWIAGGHSRGSGVAKDILKYNAATVLGWRVLRCQPNDLCRLETVKMIKKVLALK